KLFTEKNKMESLSQFSFLHTYLFPIKYGYIAYKNNLVELQAELENNKIKNNFNDQIKGSIRDYLIEHNIYNEQYIKTHIKVILSHLKVGNQVLFQPDNIDYYNFIAGYINNIHFYKDDVVKSNIKNNKGNDNGDNNTKNNYLIPDSIIVELVAFNPVKYNKCS